MFKLKSPCKDCPFRNEKGHQKGWLGKERAADIYRTLKDGMVFPCHKTVDHKEAEYEDEEEKTGFQLQEQNQFCAGALILLEKTGDADHSKAVQIGERLGLYDKSQLRIETSPVFDTELEFENWHDRRK